LPPCTKGNGLGWEVVELESNEYDIISDPDAPLYHNISESEPQVLLKSLFNCFAQIPDNGAIYSVKLCVDLPVNGIWNAPINLSAKSPGHTFLTLTKTNGNQSISQSVGFYPIGSGGTPIRPNASGGFKNNGYPKHEYNAALEATNITASQFSLVLEDLISKENSTYNIFENNCTTIALQAFNLLMEYPLVIEPFKVQMLYSATTFIFFQSPQKLYKKMKSIHPGTGLIKEFDVISNSPESNNICL